MTSSGEQGLPSEGQRAAWQACFCDHDAFLMPAGIVPAFGHNHDPDDSAHVLKTPEGPRRYTNQLFWASLHRGRPTRLPCAFTRAIPARTRSAMRNAGPPRRA